MKRGILVLCSVMVLGLHASDEHCALYDEASKMMRKPLSLLQLLKSAAVQHEVEIEGCMWDCLVNEAELDGLSTQSSQEEINTFIKQYK